MKLLGRTFVSLLRAAGASRLSPYDSLDRHFMVWPTDIDINLHLNNGRYLQFVDVARLEWLARTGILRAIVRHRWKPILGGTLVRYRRQLGLWRRCRVSTRCIGYVDNWVFLEHIVYGRDGRVAASCVTRAAFRRRGGFVPIVEVARVLGETMEPWLPPPVVEEWLRAEQHLAGLELPPILPAAAPDVTPSGDEASLRVTRSA